MIAHLGRALIPRAAPCALRCTKDPDEISAAAHARAAGHAHLAERLDTVVDKDQTTW